MKSPVKFVMKLKLWAYQLRLVNAVKSLIIFFPTVIFLQTKFLDSGLFLKLSQVAIYFLFLSFAVYLFNDLQDLKRDKAHQIKRMRPLAANEISKKSAYLAILLFVATGSVGLLYQGVVLFIYGLIYLGLSVFYTKWGKQSVLLSALLLGVFHVIRFCVGQSAGGYPFSLMLVSIMFLIFIGVATCLHQEEFVQMWGARKTKILYLFSAATSAVMVSFFPLSTSAKENFLNLEILFFMPILLSYLYFVAWKIYGRPVNSLYRLAPALKSKRLWIAQILVLAVLLKAKGIL